jgi:RNA polymerase sigma factor for flagellar operon FliA
MRGHIPAPDPKRKAPGSAGRAARTQRRVETNLKAIELKDLWRRYKDDGDQGARERLVLAYAPLVKYVAGRMSSGLPAHVEEADLISYGLLGLISAIERFDPGREIRFETFAITRIKGSIIDELRSLDWVPRSVRARAREIERTNAKLEHQLHRAPNDREMAAALDMSVEEFQDSLVKISNSSVVALDELWTVSDASGDTVSLLDTIQDPGAVDPAREMDLTDMRDRLADAIARLPEREKLVVALYYYENLTLREIGEVLGVTESRVSQLHTKAVLRLKSRLQGDPLGESA